MATNSLTETVSDPKEEPARPKITRLYLREGVIYAIICFIAGLMDFVTQAIFKRAMSSHQGEFGLLQSALSEAAIFTVPLTAINQCLTHYLARYEVVGDRAAIEKLQRAAQTLVEWVAISFALVALLGITAINYIFQSPRVGLEILLYLFTLELVAAAVSGSFCLGLSRFRVWGGLLLAAGFVRVTLAGLFAWSQPYAEVGLLVTMAASLLLLLPMLLEELETQEQSVRYKEAWAMFTNRDFLVFFGACFSVNLALYLFARVDAVIAQRWFGVVAMDQWTPVFPAQYDSYLAGGILGRALLFATAPLLAVFFTQRSQLNKTSLSSLKLFFLHAGMILLGATIIILIRRPLLQAFCGTVDSAQEKELEKYLYLFAVAMVPIGWIQGVGTFCLASRRLPECWLLGTLGVAYTILLFLFGRQPDIMISYMFGASACSLLLTLFFGIVRWSRTQP